MECPTDCLLLCQYSCFLQNIDFSVCFQKGVDISSCGVFSFFLGNPLILNHLSVQAPLTAPHTLRSFFHLQLGSNHTWVRSERRLKGNFLSIKVGFSKGLLAFLFFRLLLASSLRIKPLSEPDRPCFSPVFSMKLSHQVVNSSGIIKISNLCITQDERLI